MWEGQGNDLPQTQAPQCLTPIFFRFRTFAKETKAAAGSGRFFPKAKLSQPLRRALDSFPPAAADGQAGVSPAQGNALSPGPVPPRQRLVLQPVHQLDHRAEGLVAERDQDGVLVLEIEIERRRRDAARRPAAP